jgi:hypothetical protein
MLTLIRWTMRRTYPLPVDRQMTALNAWASQAGQIGNGRNPPGEAIRGPSRSSTALDPEPTAQTDPERKFNLIFAWCQTRQLPAASFDYLVGAGEDRLRHRQTERVGGL